MSRPRSPARLYLRRSRKDRPPTWVVRDGKKEVGTGAGRNDRQRAEEAFLQEYLAHNYRPPEGANRPDQILITEALTAYMLAVEGKPSAAHIRSMSKSLIAWWADKTIADILGDSCRAYVDWRITQPIRSYTRNKPRLATPETARQELATLRTAVRYYHREYRLSEALPLFTLPEKAPPKDSYWTREDAARRLWAARKSPHTRHLCRLILLGIYSGTRPGALIRMRWLPSLTSGHIDVENGLLYRAPRGRKQSNKRQDEK